MDYFAEIAHAVDVFEVVDRLAGHHQDHPSHLHVEPYPTLRREAPRLWRAELINWFYYKPAYARAVWEESEYAEQNRKRIAQECVRLIREAESTQEQSKRLVDWVPLSNSVRSIVGVAFKNLPQPKPVPLHLQFVIRFYPNWLQPVLNYVAASLPAIQGQDPLALFKQAAPVFRPARAEWIRMILTRTPYPALDPHDEAAIAEAMKPTSLGPSPGKTLLLALKEATQVRYQPPRFVDRLLKEIADRSKEQVVSGNANLQAGLAGGEAAAWLIENRSELRRIANDLRIPLPFAMMHESELAHVGQTRIALRGAAPAIPVASTIPAASPIRRALDANLVGLAFSGGGIRSATFSLGVLQSLAKFNILKDCDYLSTVSGGGYIGAWFHAWARREQLQRPNDAPGGQREMRKHLSPSKSPDPLDAEVRPIRFLREFSNYLTPESSFFSADTWTMVAIYLRNALLNLLVLIPLLAAALLLPRMIFAISEWLFQRERLSAVFPALLRGPVLVPAILVGLSGLALLFLGLNLRRMKLHNPLSGAGGSGSWRNGPIEFYARQKFIQLYVVLPLLLISWLVSTSFWVWLHDPYMLSNGRLLVSWVSLLTWDWTEASFLHNPLMATLFGGISTLLLFPFIYSRRETDAGSKQAKIWWFRIGAAVCSALGAAGIVLVLRAATDEAATAGWQQTVLLELAVVLLFTSGFIVYFRRLLLQLIPRTRVVALAIAGSCGILVSAALFLLGYGARTLAPLVHSRTLSFPLWLKGVIDDRLEKGALGIAILVALFLIVFAALPRFSHYWRSWYQGWSVLLLALLSSGAVAYGLFWGIGKFLYAGDNQMWPALIFGAPMALTAFSIVVAVHLGILGTRFPDECREWWSRLRAWALIYSATWILLFVLALEVPRWYDKFTAWGGWSVLGFWALSTFLGVRAGPAAAAKNENQSSHQAPGQAIKLPAAVVRFAANVAPYVFILGLLALISVALDRIIGSRVTGVILPEYWARVTSFPNASMWAWICASLGVSFFVSWRIGVNEFSMHDFYKNRLVRCYLGASRWKNRMADWFTGFDPDDDMRLSDLDGESAPPYIGPYPLLNCALNLVGGEDLAWQERKAASFVFSPRYCGYDVDRAVLTTFRDDAYWPDAYAPTRDYGFGKEGPLLGSAMAISGAAVNANMGRETSAASAFLMTVFNVRLGWWVPNSRRKRSWLTENPGLGLKYTTYELFGLTDDKTHFVNVSDGGHFENLSAYELIRRGCRCIIISDAGQDGGFKFDDLGNFVRKCRTDFGVEIDISVDRIVEKNATGSSKAHCVVGKIHYLGVPKHDSTGKIEFKDGKPVHEEGWLIYMKPSITGDEPHDILEYHKRVKEFPHETTADQWFTESQFESYRALGFHIAEQTFERVRRHDASPFDGPSFGEMYDIWHAPSVAVDSYSTQHALEYSRIMELVRSREDLGFLDSVLFASGIQDRDEFYICNSLIQLIENVYADLDLEQNYDHPHVQGWMSTFKVWAGKPAFKRTWTAAKNTYAVRFQKFCKDRLDLN
jgi:hypothetical protein